MAYNHSRYEIEMVPATVGGASLGGQAGPTAVANGVLLSVTGVAAKWAPGYVPHKIRGAAIIPSVTLAMTDDVFVRFDADLTTPGTATTLFTINLPTAGAIHKSVYYTPTYNIEVAPGQVLSANVTAAATAGIYGKIVLYVEPRWEEPGNITGMLKST
jgi:hypothetical protein